MISHDHLEECEALFGVLLVRFGPAPTCMPSSRVLRIPVSQGEELWKNVERDWKQAQLPSSLTCRNDAGLSEKPTINQFFE